MAEQLMDQADDTQPVAGQAVQQDAEIEQPDTATDPELDVDTATEDSLAEESYSWQASEYVHHHKGAGWYAVLAIIVVILLLVAIIFKLWLSIGVFLAMGAAIVVYAYKPPRVLTYQLDSKHIIIENKPYPFESFRSFGVLSDESWHTIDLEPAKRFMPRLTVLFSDEDFDNVVAHLEAHLPRADREPDMVERLSRYLRF